MNAIIPTPVRTAVAVDPPVVIEHFDSWALDLSAPVVPSGTCIAFDAEPR